MKVVEFVGTRQIGAELTSDERAAQLALIPGDVAHYQLSDGFADELFRDVTEHFVSHGAALQLIRYRGELAPITVADLAAFAVPILPAE